MLGALEYEYDDDFSRFLEVQALDQKTRRRAEVKFEEYRNRGVILNEEYLDDVWVLQSDIETVRLRFSFDREVYEQHAEKWIGCDFETYVESARAFAALCLGSVVLPSIRTAVGAIRELVAVSSNEVLPERAKASADVAFLSLLPGKNPDREAMIWEITRNGAKRHARHPRKLRPFREYVLFHNHVQNYWNTAGEKEREYYFPVYLWWNLTTILPLRPTEFLLIPRECLSVQDGIRILTVRRTKLKKKRRGVSYRIRDDYEEHRYEIPNWLADAIRKYQDCTAGKRLPEAGTLFVSESSETAFFSYETMRKRLHAFCEVSGSEFRPRLGDTRHLAMISLILSGGSPSVCRELAGHEDIDISSNYYANLSQVIREAAYDYCHRNSGDVSLGGRIFYPLAVPEAAYRVEDGWCGAPGTEQGRIEACLQTFSAEGGIGDCRKCRYFYPDDPGVRLEIEEERRSAVDSDGVFLLKVIEKVRKGIGREETMRAALARLQSESQGYGALLCRKYQEEMKNGKDRTTEEDGQ